MAEAIVIPTKSQIRTGKGRTRLQVFVLKFCPDDRKKEFRMRLSLVLEENRVKENMRLMTIIQDYLQFIPESHLEDLINKLK